MYGSGGPGSGTVFGTDGRRKTKSSPPQRFFGHEQGVILAAWDNLLSHKALFLPEILEWFWRILVGNTLDFEGNLARLWGGKLFLPTAQYK